MSTLTIECPRCSVPLNRAKEPPYLLWKCSVCNGQAVTMAVLRKEIAESFLRDAWQRSGKTIGRSARRCPSCRQNLPQVRVDGLEIELCRSCQLIWFDPGELEAAPVQSDKERARRRWDNEIAEQRRRRVRQDTWDNMLRHRIYASPL